MANFQLVPKKFVNVVANFPGGCFGFNINAKIVGIADKPQTLPFKFPVQFMQHDVGQ
jgi:hypothetical protein